MLSCKYDILKEEAGSLHSGQAKKLYQSVCEGSPWRWWSQNTSVFCKGIFMEVRWGQCNSATSDHRVTQQSQSSNNWTVGRVWSIVSWYPWHVISLSFWDILHHAHNSHNNMQSCCVIGRDWACCAKSSATQRRGISFAHKKWQCQMLTHCAKYSHC